MPSSASLAWMAEELMGKSALAQAKTAGCYTPAPILAAGGRWRGSYESYVPYLGAAARAGIQPQASGEPV